MKEKQVKMFNEDFEEYLTDIPRLRFLEFDEEDVQINNNSVDISGSDGTIEGPMNFGPFNLILRFSYLGDNYRETLLIKEKLRQTINKREPYYIWHSEMPGKKYAVVPSGQKIEMKTDKFLTFEITFSVYKGYSESLKDTSEFSWSDEHWQFEQGVLTEDDIKYKHSVRYFKIYNGSNDTINPLLRHKLNIYLELYAPHGFELVNLTTGDIFEYKKQLKKGTKLKIIGVHPYIADKRVGINTNYNFITLAPGWNEILIRGKSITHSPKSQFVFNFIYR